MAARLCLLVCERFHAEAAAATAAEGWEDVACVRFAARCGRPPLQWAELQALLPADCERALMFGHACVATVGAGQPLPADLPPLEQRPLAQCFDLVAPPPLVAEAVQRGAYLMTPAWLAAWPARLAELGFAPEQAGDFFAECAQELLLLDTGADSATDSATDTGTEEQGADRLQALAAQVGLPARRIPVGLEGTRARLVREVLGWRLQRAQREARELSRLHAGERADQAAALDLLGRLARASDEAGALQAVQELLQALFAPQAVHAARVVNGVDLPAEGTPAEVQAALAALAADYAFTEGGDGFLLRIGRGDAAVAKIAVLGLAFPAQRERYLNTALALTDACALAVDNARMRQQLVQADKMAAMSILVSGVAHEISTPLGVDLVAASALQQQTQRLAQRFAQRQMTAAELGDYLQAAQEETALIRSNLERIGTLVDTFRRAATGGPAPQAEQVPLLACVQEVLRSLGDRVQAAGASVQLSGDEALQVRGVRSDWASVFTNLIDNALQHGFRGRSGGEIHVALSADAQHLRVQVRDNGRGMPPEVLARVFDPFFTTELQHNMGLGLHLVYNLVTHRLGGRIGCDSRPGAGACFHIEVPR